MALTTHTEAQYLIGERTVRKKYFEYPARGFQPWEIQQITSLAVGESVVIREHTILRIPDKRLDTADASGFFVGFVVATFELAWIARSAWHALFAHDWLYSAANWLANAGAMLLANIFNTTLETSPSTFALVSMGFMLVCVCSSLALAFSVITGEYVAEAVDVILKSDSPRSVATAMIDLCAPVLAAAVGALCLESGLGVEASLIGAGAVFGLGLISIRYFVQGHCK